MKDLPNRQTAVQLVGPNELRLEHDKPVYQPGPHQLVAEVEAVGLCFSDLKLLAQFDQHVRKAPIVSGLSPEVLAEIPSYKPGAEPTVPGHELCVRIVALGPGVEDYEPGQRVLVQPDWRLLKTPGANGACGYNFEGALQQYLLLDERILGSPSEPETYNLMEAPESLSAAAVAMVEPWACVENSYVTPERQHGKSGGKALIVVVPGRSSLGLEATWPAGPPAEAHVWAAPSELARIRGFVPSAKPAPDDLPREAYDDVILFGADADLVERVHPSLAKEGILNLVLGGLRLGREPEIGMGRIHYGYTRYVGTNGLDASESYATIPPNGEVRSGERALVVGAGGPMGQMHVIRLISRGAHVVASDLDEERLDSLRAKAQAIGSGDLETYNPKTDPDPGLFDLIAIMAPVPELVREALTRARPGARVNIFAGIPATVSAPLDLNEIVDKRIFVFGTSGSEPADMRAVLEQVQTGALRVDVSVSAVSGMAGAIDGLQAVKDRSMGGKIVVYPRLSELGLVPLDEMPATFPSVAKKMNGQVWTKAAEDELLRVAR